MSMNNVIGLIIPGTPNSKDRSRKGAQGRWYNTQKDLMDRVRLEIKYNKLPDKFKIIKKGIPVRVDFVFYFKPLKSEKNKIGAYLKKPDSDNCIKFYLDCMSKLVFFDDNQVYDIHSIKFYSDEPRTEISIYY